jgi:hypothetical protein
MVCMVMPSRAKIALVWVSVVKSMYKLRLMESNHNYTPKSPRRKLGLATVTILGQGSELSLEARQSCQTRTQEEAG